MTKIIMPQMGESIVEGTLVKWRKKHGERVQQDEIILEISTDKVDSEIPSPATGKLERILVEEGETVAVGTVLAFIDDELSNTTSSTGGSNPTAAPEGRYLTPLVKKMAREHGLSPADLSSINGTGAHGRIAKQDLLNYLAAPERQPLSAAVLSKPLNEVKPESDHIAGRYGPDKSQIIPMDHVRKRIAERMMFSKATAAHVTSVAEADVTRIVKYRDLIKEAFEKREGFPLTFSAFFVQAAAQALREFPLLNASVEGDQIVLKNTIHIGIAVGMEKGLVVPVIRNADQLSLVGLARSVYDLATRARNKQLQPQEVQEGTFSITNIGTYGSLLGTPIINQPQVGILATGAIKKRLEVMQDDTLAIRSMMYLSLTYDHRIIDGLLAGSFLQRIVQNLQAFTAEALGEERGGK
jgi:pyruvate dehydrogenase E2 component (dihydrolipoamide acetyltransferase)